VKYILLKPLAALGLILGMAITSTTSARAQVTAFTYQGRLDDGGAPANGIYDLRFAIYNAASGGAQQGAALTKAATAVSDGLFTVTLDFGAGIFTGAARWLEIGVRTNGGGGFNALAPRQPLTATPYATTASNLAGSINAAQISGPLALDQLPPEVVANFASGVKLEGSFLGDGGGLTGLDAAQLAAPFRWRSCPPPRRPCIFNNQQLKK